MPTQSFNSSGTFICPSGTTSVFVECWGPGTDGGEIDGGGGGAYASGIVTVVPGNNYTVVVGIHNSWDEGAMPKSTRFGSNDIVAEGAVGGQGGQTTGCVGTTLFNGGNGGFGVGTQFKIVTGTGEGEAFLSLTDFKGGGGGGSATSSGPGGDGGAATLVGGIGGIGQGNGGRGAPPFPGLPGSSPGGGGGGGTGVGQNGIGANGLVLVTCSNCSGAGDPHFTGFDGKRFDFHGKADTWYLLYQDDIVTINAKHIKVDHPAHKNDTFIGEIQLIHDGRELRITKNDTRKQFDGVINLEASKKCLVPSLQFIGGAITDSYMVILPHGSVVISRTMGAVSHLNVTFNLFSKVAIGILGQTIGKERIPNENYEISPVV